MNSIYFVGRCKALETKLLSNLQLNELIKCRELAEVVTLLNSYNFLKGENVTTFSDLLTLIDREEQEFLAFLKRSTPNENFTKFFTLKYDYFNAESVYIAKKLNETPPLINEGLLRIETLEKIVASRKYDILSVQMSNCMKYCDELGIGENFTGFNVDTAFKRALYEEMREVSKKNKLLRKYCAFVIDMQNISLAIRLRDKKMFESVRLVGGTLNDSVFNCLIKDDADTILATLAHSDYISAIKLLVTAIKHDEPFYKFDYMFDCFPITFFDKYKYETEGDAPYLRYCFLKENELINLKIIIQGLIANRNRQKMSDEIRRVYE